MGDVIHILSVEGGGGQLSIKLARMCVSKSEENGSLSFASSE